MIGVVKYVCIVLNADDHGEGIFLSLFFPFMTDFSVLSYFEFIYFFHFYFFCFQVNILLHVFISSKPFPCHFIGTRPSSDNI